ncbi:hypothetical protein EVAR_25831_1 [Eumeta japonica]|uniref:Uncharacterized protein n=1 Tax=Eumeta variegata TaxID=151549 RepID=A0A4C1VWC0_EUMVA|nr:hypothetical protein EVAR_25831_1 [Eumeta japonica]
MLLVDETLLRNCWLQRRVTAATPAPTAQYESWTYIPTPALPHKSRTGTDMEGHPPGICSNSHTSSYMITLQVYRFQQHRS